MDLWTEDPPIPRVAKPRLALPNERSVDFPVPQIWEEIVEVVSLVPQEYVQRQTDERFVNVPVPPILEDIVEVVRRAPQELAQRRLWMCLFLILWKRLSKSSNCTTGAIFRKGSVNRSWTSLFRRWRRFSDFEGER